jgi:hypothetical protein
LCDASDISLDRSGDLVAPTNTDHRNIPRNQCRLVADGDIARCEP